jgi:hypothetical protein
VSDGADDRPPEAEMGYTEYRCRNCGRTTPKNTPPCDRCGGYDFERVEVTASDFDDEVRAPSNVQLVRENPAVATGIVVVLAGLLVAALAYSGAVVVADPTGTYRFGAVSATPVDDDGTLTAGEFRTRLAAEHDVAAMRWSGRGLSVRVETDAAANDAVVAEVMAVARSYATYVDAGGEAATLELTVDTPDGDARVRIDGDDARAYADGDISEGAYRDRVFGQ